MLLLLRLLESDEGLSVLPLPLLEAEAEGAAAAVCPDGDEWPAFSPTKPVNTATLDTPTIHFIHL